jgi:hypothetical protein
MTMILQIMLVLKITWVKHKRYPITGLVRPLGLQEIDTFRISETIGT